MSDRQYPDRQSRDLESSLAGKPAEESPLPGLDNMLREAADDATRRALVPPYGLVQGLVRRRRTARIAMAGAFGAVAVLTIGMVAVTAAGPGRDEGRPQPAASATVLDPSLRQYWTEIPILSWTRDAARGTSSTPDPAKSRRSDVSHTNEFRTAIFSALGSGDHDYSSFEDLRKVFPDAPVGGPAIAIDQSVTKAELEQAAANLRKLGGVRDARVVEVSGLWFTVSATGPADTTSTDTGDTRPPILDTQGLVIRGSASGQERDGQDRWVNWVRATYLGPAIDRATFDLVRVRAAEAVRIDVSQVVVTAESSERNPEPTTS